MLQLDRNVLSVALASAMLLGSATAQAQSTDPDTTPQDNEVAEQAAAPAPQADAADAQDATELDRVTVTGIRRGIENAIETKRTSTSIVRSEEHTSELQSLM